nr:MAG TPA: hypothetical protein [Caudoviricetes sp.]
MQRRLIVAMHLENRIRPAFRPCDGTDIDQANRPCDGTPTMVYCRLEVREIWMFGKGTMFPAGEVRLDASGDRACIACQRWQSRPGRYYRAFPADNTLAIRIQPFEESCNKSK